jgi:predicted ester cyclase
MPNPNPRPTASITTIVERFFDQVLTAQDRAVAEEIVVPDFQVHHPSSREPMRGFDALFALIGQFHAGFPDVRYRVDEMIADGNRAVVRWTATGTHEGSFFGVAPTHQRVSVVGADIFHGVDGRLTATWVNSDLFGLFTQLGSFPRQ